MKNHRLGAILGAGAVAAIASLTFGLSSAGAADGIVGVVDVNGATNTAGNVGQVVHDPTVAVQNDTNADGHVCLSIFAPFPCGAGAAAPGGGSGTDVEGNVVTDDSADAAADAGDSTDVEANAALNADANLSAGDDGSSDANTDDPACSDGATSNADESGDGPISGKTLSLTGVLGALAAGAVGIQRHRSKAGL